MLREMRPACLLALAFCACSRVGAIDAPRRPLAGPEPQTVRQKSEEALATKDYAAAWNHELHAGADRARLETVFLAALAADERDAEDMIGQLRQAHGGLTPDAQAKVKQISDAAADRKEWTRAAEIHLVAASDAPEFSAAWDVYRRAPPKDALDVLETIQEARKEHEEATAKRGP